MIEKIIIMINYIKIIYYLFLHVQSFSKAKWNMRNIVQ